VDASPGDLRSVDLAKSEDERLGAREALHRRILRQDERPFKFEHERAGGHERDDEVTDREVAGEQSRQPLGAERVALTRGFLFLGEQRLSSKKPISL